MSAEWVTDEKVLAWVEATKVFGISTPERSQLRMVGDALLAERAARASTKAQLDALHDAIDAVRDECMVDETLGYAGVGASRLEAVLVALCRAQTAALDALPKEPA